MVLLTFVWKCFQDRNFHGVVVGLYEQSIESWVGLGCRPTSIHRLGPSCEACFSLFLVDWWSEQRDCIPQTQVRVP